MLGLGEFCDVDLSRFGVGLGYFVEKFLMPFLISMFIDIIYIIIIV